MRDYYINIGKDPFEVLPFTYLVKKGITDREFAKFEDYYYELEEQIKINDARRAMEVNQRQKEIDKEKA